MMGLNEFGDRICIMGPSNSGKSTLAYAIAQKIGAEAVHLDQLFHLPATDWKPRAFTDFRQLHDAAIEAPRWVMDGNYSQLLPQRLGRATGFILLDIPMPLSLLRYIRRSVFRRGPIGSLGGGKDSVKWSMLKHIAIRTPKNRRRYAALLRTIEIPKVYLVSPQQIDACYSAWGLQHFKPR